MIEANEALFERVIGLVIEVHRILGPGLLETIYELALCQEPLDAGVEFARQKEIEVRYKGRLLGIKRGLILNFNSAPLKRGSKRISI